TPEDLFSDNIRVGGEFDKSLVTCMPGCYSSMARVKQAYRRTENLFYAVEKMLTAATICGMNIDLKKMREAEKQLLLSGFHDILPGTCIEEGESEGLGLLSSCERTLKEYRTQAFLYFTVDQSSAKEGEYPIFVFNFMPYAIKTPVEAEFSLADQNWEEDIRFVPYVYDEKGEKINCQQIKEESTINLDWRKRIVFEGKLNPLGITRFTVKVKPEKKKGQRTVSAGEESSAKLEIYDDTLDPWGMSKEESEAVGKNPRQFKLMTEREAGIFIGTRERTLPVRIIERGEVFDETESLYKACGTRAVIRRRVYKNQPFTDYCVTVEYADKNKLIRIKFPLPDEFRGGKVVGDGPYVWEEKPNGEFTFQKWVGVENQGRIFSVVNDCVYSGKCDGEYLYMTLLRGAGYCIHPIPDRELCPKDRYLPRIESGRYVYKFRIFEGNIADTTKIAELFNCLPYAVNVFPVGKGDKATESVVVDGDVILTSARAADGKIRLRLYNPDKRDKRFKLRVLGNEVGLQAKKGEIVSLTYENGVFINNK
ncbi:MAG: hypothetical protein IJS67_01360, partial [Clostridia bacterium]|nr:hypothetical protein [Clostridia bacterium]